MKTRAQIIVEEDIQAVVADIDRATWQKLEGKNFLITGPQGMIAAYIVNTIEFLNRHILQKPCTVIGLARSPIDPNGIIGHTLSSIPFHYFYNASDINCRLNTCDYVIHAAGRSAPQVFVDDPIGTIDINTIMLQWLLESAVHYKMSRFVWFSSAEIYGSPADKNIPTPESYPGMTDSIGPRSCYTESKRCGEALCMAYYRKYQVPITIFRPMLVYGPGLTLEDKRVMAEFIKMGLTKPPIVLKDEGLTSRAYCYITDAMRLFWQAFFSSRAIGEVFNMANSQEETSIFSLACDVHSLCNIKQPVQITTIKNENVALSSAPLRVCASTKKAREFFDYNPIVSLREGLARTIDWNRLRLE